MKPRRALLPERALRLAVATAAIGDVSAPSWPPQGTPGACPRGSILVRTTRHARMFRVLRLTARAVMPR